MPGSRIELLEAVDEAGSEEVDNYCKQDELEKSIE